MFTIRKTKIEDVESIIELEKKYLGETIGDMLFTELMNPVAFFFTAEINNEVVGYIGGWIIEDSLEIINLVVDETYQRQGIGTKLIDTISNVKNIKEIILDVRCTNQKAINFYQKLGFKEINKRLGYYKNGDDAYVLRKMKEGM